MGEGDLEVFVQERFCVEEGEVDKRACGGRYKVGLGVDVVEGEEAGDGGRLGKDGVRTSEIDAPGARPSETPRRDGLSGPGGVAGDVASCRTGRDNRALAVGVLKGSE